MYPSAAAAHKSGQSRETFWGGRISGRLRRRQVQELQGGQVRAKNYTRAIARSDDLFAADLVGAGVGAHLHERGAAGRIHEQILRIIWRGRAADDQPVPHTLDRSRVWETRQYLGDLEGIGVVAVPLAAAAHGRIDTR